MTTGVLLIVLAAALLHALWNSLVKSAPDKFLSSALVCLWSGVVGLVAAFALPGPFVAALPYIVASALIHIGYFLLVGRLYRDADLSVVYPIMRGLAPLFAAVIAALAIHEIPRPLAMLGVLALVAGVLTMAASGLAHGRVDRAALGFAVLNSAVIAAYTVVDGAGARLAGPGAAHAFGYNAWADVLTAALYGPVVLALRGRPAIAAIAGGWRRGLPGGACLFLAYALVIFAMTRAPIASVAAVRESSVVFGALIGVLVLGEPFRHARLGAALLILAGVVALRLA